MKNIYVYVEYLQIKNKIMIDMVLILLEISRLRYP